MVEQVEETAQRRIAAMAQPLAGVLRDVRGKRPVRAEKAEEPHLEARRPPNRRCLERRDGCRREREIRILSETHRLVEGTQRASQARLVGEQALESAQG